MIYQVETLNPQTTSAFLSAVILPGFPPTLIDVESVSLAIGVALNAHERHEKVGYKQDERRLYICTEQASFIR